MLSKMLPTMSSRLLCAAAVLCGALHVSVSLPSRATAMRGPSSVIEAVRAFLLALDKGDTTMLDLLVGDHDPRDGYVVVPDESAKSGIRQLEKDDGNIVVSRFFDVSHDGRPFHAKDKKIFLTRLGRHVSGSKANTRTLTTRFRTIRADCPSPWCSYAVVEFERTYCIGGVRQEPVLMQATALVRYVKRKDVEVPHFEIFHWHASPAVPTRRAAAGARTAEAAGQNKKG